MFSVLQSYCIIIHRCVLYHKLKYGDNIGVPWGVWQLPPLIKRGGNVMIDSWESLLVDLIFLAAAPSHHCTHSGLSAGQDGDALSHNALASFLLAWRWRGGHLCWSQRFLKIVCLTQCGIRILQRKRWGHFNTHSHSPVSQQEVCCCGHSGIYWCVLVWQCDVPPHCCGKKKQQSTN